MTKYIGFDIESTGVDPEIDRIVTFSIVTSEGSVHEWLINPGVEIPEGAASVHGITTEKALADGLDPEEAIKDIWETLNAEATDGSVLAAYNCPFDLTMLQHELVRYGVATPEELNSLVCRVGIIDPLVIDKATDKYRRGSRKLIDVASNYGYTLTNAHNSTADVEATLFLADMFYEKFKDKVSMNELMQMQAEAKAEQSKSLSEYFRKQGREDWEVDGSWPIRLIQGTSETTSTPDFHA